jgi:hypothetical protein
MSGKFTVTANTDGVLDGVMDGLMDRLMDGAMDGEWGIKICSSIKPLSPPSDSGSSVGSIHKSALREPVPCVMCSCMSTVRFLFVSFKK